MWSKLSARLFSPGNFRVMTPDPRAIARAPGAFFVLVVLLGFAAHGPAWRAPFIFDDGICILENESIVTLSRIGDVLWPPVNASGVSGRPLVNLSLALNYALGGLDPTGYHCLNILLHVWVGVLLLAVVAGTLRRALGPREAAKAPWLALATALVWVAHPLQTESVACTIQRTEILGGFFYLLTTWCFLRSTESTRPVRWWVAAVLAGLAGVASKEIVATVPLFILLLDRTLVAGSWREAWRRRAGLYLGLALIWVLLGLFLFMMGGSRGEAAGFGAGPFPWWAYFLRQWEAITTYLKLVFWPQPLVLDYGCDVVLSVREVAGRGALLFLLGGITVWGVIRHRRWSVAAAAFFLILGPSSSVMPLPAQTAAEHRMYLPLAAVVVLCVLGVWRLLGSRRARLVLVAVVPLGLLSALRSVEFQSPLGIWRQVILLRPGNVRAHYHAGEWCFTAGRWEEAASHYNAALQVSPTYAGAWVGRANLAYRRGDFAAAIQGYQRALALEPDHGPTLGNLGAALWTVGRRDEAVAQLRRLTEVKPSFPNGHFNLGTIYLQLGDLASAQASLERAIRLRPTHAESHNNLGIVFLRTARPRDAERCFAAALRLQPDFVDAKENLAAARARR